MGVVDAFGVEVAVSVPSAGRTPGVSEDGSSSGLLKLKAFITALGATTLGPVPSLLAGGAIPFIRGGDDEEAEFGRTATGAATDIAIPAFLPIESGASSGEADCSNAASLVFRTVCEW